MHIDGSPSDDHLVAPDLVQDHFPFKHFTGLGGQQGQEFKFFAWQNDLDPFVDNFVFLPVDDNITNLYDVLDLVLVFFHSAQ